MNQNSVISCTNSSVVIGFGLSQVLECPEHRQKFCSVMNISYLHQYLSLHFQNHQSTFKCSSTALQCAIQPFLSFSVDHLFILPCNALFLQLLHLFT